MVAIICYKYTMDAWTFSLARAGLDKHRLERLLSDIWFTCLKLYIYYVFSDKIFKPNACKIVAKYSGNYVVFRAPVATAGQVQPLPQVCAELLCLSLRQVPWFLESWWVQAGRRYSQYQKLTVFLNDHSLSQFQGFVKQACWYISSKADLS